MKNNSKDKDISLGRRHYWTDTQGQAHRVVFDDGKLEKPRSTWIVLASVTLFALIFGVVVLIVICCAIASKDNKEPQSKDDWRGLP